MDLMSRPIDGHERKQYPRSLWDRFMEFIIGIPVGAAAGCTTASVFCLIASRLGLNFASPTADTFLNVIAASATVIMICGPLWEIRTFPFWAGSCAGALIGISLFASEHVA